MEIIDLLFTFKESEILDIHIALKNQMFITSHKFYINISTLDKNDSSMYQWQCIEPILLLAAA